LIKSSKVTGLEINAEETKRVVMLRDQHVGENNTVTGGNKSFKRVEHFKYLRTTLTN